MLTIFAEKTSNRLQYTLDLIFKDREVPFQIVTSFEAFNAAAAPKFSYYAGETIPGILNISPSSLLFEENIQAQEAKETLWQGVPVISFKKQADILASIFYVASLYDDYLVKEKDKHNRNLGENSILYRLKWLDKLMVERWSEFLIELIEKVNDCKLLAKKIPFEITPTFDIDHAYAYKLRGNLRQYFSLTKDVLLQNKKRIIERSEVLNEKIKDPFDTYSTILKIIEKYPSTKLFWLLGDYGKMDRNISFAQKEHRALIKQMDAATMVGLHPSYASNKSLKQLLKEKKRLCDILQKEVLFSRQHYLMVHLPQTYENLEAAGFSDDYSLGYADQPGFRAGIARPFPWFNLTKNRISKLILHPFTYMDGTLKEYQELSINEAINTVRGLKREVERFGGVFMPLWHNETIGDYGDWEGWSAVLLDTLGDE